MLRRLQLLGFRGFAELDLDLAQVTAVVGRNSSGKTSVLHAIRLVCDLVSELLEDPATSPWIPVSSTTVMLCRDAVVPDPGKFLSLSDWRQVFTDAVVGEGVKAEIQLFFDDKDPVAHASLTLSYGRNAQLKMTAAVQSKAALAAVAGQPPKSKYRPAKLLEALQRSWPSCVYVPAFYGVTSTEEYRTRPVVNRLLGSGDQSHIVRNLLARMDGPAIIKMNAFLRRALGAEVAQWTSSASAEQRGYLTATYRDTNGELELSSAGAGLVGLVSLYAAMEGFRGRGERSVMFLLDEPEAHLHPRLQGDVGEELARLAREFGNQIVFATHSVEMINRVSRDPHALLASVDRTTGSAVTLRGEDELVRALDDFCDLTPFSSLSFLSSRRVLFHEGPTDFQVLDACARAYFRSDDERLQSWKRYVAIALDGVGNVSANGVLEKILSPKLFGRLDASRAVRAVLVQDRDYRRDPRVASLRQIKPHFHAVETVWSRHSIESLFLDAPCLAQWLAPSLPKIAPEALLGAVERAVDVVDADGELADNAEDGRYAFHRRTGKDHKQLDERAARKVARDEVRSSPVTWQQGKARAGKILAEVRKSLGAAGHSIRGSLVDVVSRASSAEISDLRIAIPAEISKLLDECVRP